MHEHAYLIGRTLEWLQWRLGTAEFEKYVETKIWFSLATAYRYLAFTRRCCAARRMLDYHPAKKKALTVRVPPPPPEPGLFRCPNCGQALRDRVNLDEFSFHAFLEDAIPFEKLSPEEVFPTDEFPEDAFEGMIPED